MTSSVILPPPKAGMMVDYLAYLFPTEIARRFSPTYQGNRSNRAAMDEIDWYVGKLKTEVRDALTYLAGLVNDDKTAPFSSHGTTGATSFHHRIKKRGGAPDHESKADPCDPL